MNKTKKINLELTIDSTSSIILEDTYDGLNDEEWYRFSPNKSGEIILEANQEGLEHLASYFLKLARTPKIDGFHTHHSMEFGQENHGEPELSVILNKQTNNV